MKTFTHLLRAALIGFLALFTVAGLMIGAELEKQGRPELAAPTNGDGAAAEPADAPSAQRPMGAMFGLGLLGALIAVGATLLLLLFPVGPTSKIVYGLVCGPALPMLLWAPSNLSRGKAGDVGAIVLLGMLLGLLVGILEANRVIRERREGRAAA